MIKSTFSIFVFYLLLGSNFLYSQLRVSAQPYAEEIVKEYFAAPEASIEFGKISAFGHHQALGVFKHDSPYALLEKGIILSTGYIQHAVGPNNKPNEGIPLFKKGDIELTRLTEAPTYDATGLVFEFRIPTDSFFFEFFFASEEYPEYINKGVNDVFGFFLYENGVEKPINLAQLPNNLGPITVDNINHLKNKEYYIPNEVWDESNIMQWKDDKEKGELAYSFQFDGFTKLIPIGVQVKPNVWYTLKIVIADVGDPEYDSAVFLKANSLNNTYTQKTANLKNVSLSESVMSKPLVKFFKEEEITKISENEFMVIGNIEFDFDKSSIRNSEQEVLQKVLKIMTQFPQFSLKIVGHTDNRGSADYNWRLSQDRANAVLQFLISEAIDKNRLSSSGKGQTMPIYSGFTEEEHQKNRRVEFFFKSN